MTRYDRVYGYRRATVDSGRLCSAPVAGGRTRQELHHGELVEIPPVKHLHTKAQRRLMDALREALSQEFLVEKEFPFRPLPQFEAWIADLAVVSRLRDQATPGDDYFRGVPEIVIEVLSPANSASEMLERESICLRNGGEQFWLCDPSRKTVKITTAQGQMRTYTVGDILPLVGFGTPLPAEPLFAPNEPRL